MSKLRRVSKLRLGVNIDHVATVRNARGGALPDPVRAALVAVGAALAGLAGVGGVLAGVMGSLSFKETADDLRDMNDAAKALGLTGKQASGLFGVLPGDFKENVEGLTQFSNAIQTALGGYQSINDLVCEGGRLRRQRDLAGKGMKRSKAS